VTATALVTAVPVTAAERGLPFSDPMVQALLDDRKTNTRRVMVPQPKPWDLNDAFLAWKGEAFFPGEPAGCPYGVPGDRLWVREAVRAWDLDGATLHIEYRAGGAPRETDTDDFSPGQIDQVRRLSQRYPKYAPAMFCPRWASRITLELTEVRVQRLQEISDDDARAEGCAGGHDSIPDYTFSAMPHEHFKHVWDSLNAKRRYGWDSNPWVWALTFKRLA
jgi:hypothetical protein